MSGDNEALAEAVVRACARAGVEEWVVCPGARNAAIIEVLVEVGERVRRFFDERSAGFFALGRSVASRKPVAVVTTSGTAVAELLPAVVEAHYRRVPLVLVTADRPKRFAGSGAPQAIEQVGIFGGFVGASIDVEAGWDESFERCDDPFHINVRLEERSGAKVVPCGRSEEAPDWSRPARTVVLLGHAEGGDHDGLRTVLEAKGVPVWAEATSGLRESLGIRGGERALREGGFERVLRIGGVPSCRFWRDLEERPEVDVVSVTRTGFPGLARESVVLDPSDWQEKLGEWRCEAVATEPDDGGVEGLLEKYPLSEPGMVRWVSTLMGRSAMVMLGNSLPIREWNAFATWEDKGLRCFANRGANGIDGLLSTYFGLCQEEPGESWAVVGDLSALYDMNAFWNPGFDGAGGSKRIVVLNNDGGRIFERLPAVQRAGHRVQETIYNPHGLDFDGLAWTWGWKRECVSGYPLPRPLELGDEVILEVRPHDDQTQAFWAEYDELMK